MLRRGILIFSLFQISETMRRSYHSAQQYLDTEMMNDIVYRVRAENLPECGRQCYLHILCQSYTYIEKKGICKLHEDVFSTREEGKGIYRKGAWYFFIGLQEENNSEILPEKSPSTLPSVISGVKGITNANQQASHTGTNKQESVPVDNDAPEDAADGAVAVAIHEEPPVFIA